MFLIVFQVAIPHYSIQVYFNLINDNSIFFSFIIAHKILSLTMVAKVTMKNHLGKVWKLAGGNSYSCWIFNFFYLYFIGFWVFFYIQMPEH